MISGPAGGTREGARPQGAMPPGPSVESCESCCHRDSVFTARCTVVHSTVLRSHVVRSSVHPSVCDVGVLGPHRSWKLTARTISPTSSLRDSHNLSAHPYWAHRAVIFAIAQLSCFSSRQRNIYNYVERAICYRRPCVSQGWISQKRLKYRIMQLSPHISPVPQFFRYRPKFNPR